MKTEHPEANERHRSVVDRYWDQHLFCDFLIVSTVFGCIIAAGHYLHWAPAFISAIDGNRSSLYSSLLSVQGTLLGFVITAATFSAGFIDSKTFGQLKKKGSFYDVFAIYSQTAIVLALGLIVALVSLIADTDKRPNILLSLANVFAVLLIIARMSKSIWILRWLAKIQEQQPLNQDARSKFRSYIED